MGTRTGKAAQVVLIEQENSKRIDELKDVLANLNTTMALNTQATTGLKEVVEKEFTRQTEGNKNLDTRLGTAEEKIGQIEIKLANSSGMLTGMRYILGVGLMCIGFVASAVLHKLFGM